MACKKRIAVLIPDEAGIIHAERLPNSTNSYTFGDARKSLFDSALYVEQCAREYLNAQPADIDAADIDAMQNLIDKGKYLRSLINDEEINNLSVPLLEKIWGLALSSHFVGKMEELAIIAPILSKEQIIRELYSMTQGGFSAAKKDRDKKARANAEKLETIQETIEDRNRHRLELWATVPDCIRAVIEMAEVERKDGKNIPIPGNYNTLRINVSDHLKKKNKRRRGSDAKPYYQTADIAEAVAIFYKAFDTKQYITEFSRIGKNAEDIPDAKPKKAEHAK